ncbi:hypothetical protein [Solibacillus daqui]|uniref:hypothetical protein n=1 Tax=Solibacillus daqui TaxID=2912187 RepID=UPI002365DACF|nr:hypothetical protein [Solibacillus daqui]
MNELKRQLDKKMGNTSQRVERIMNNINDNKRQKENKKAPQKLYYVTFAGFIALLVAITIITNPFSSNSPNTATPVPTDSNKPAIQIEEPEDYSEILKKFFKQDGDVAHFLGTGNEFAGFTETTTWLSNNYVQILEDNGGAVSQKVYRITKETIELIYQDIAEPTAKVFTNTELTSLAAIQTVLQWPLVDGDSIDDISVQLPVEIKTPYKTFSNTIMLSEIVESGKNDYYYAEGYGLVARIFKTSDGYQIASFLASINEPPATTSDEKISFLNVDTNKQETLLLQSLPFIDKLHPYTSTDDFELTYDPLFSTDNGEFGVFTTYCNDYNCQLAFVMRNADRITSGPIVYARMTGFKRSPNFEKVIIALQSPELYEDTFIERSMLKIINVQTMQVEVPTSQEIYFSEQSYPISYYDWVDDTTIQLEVADVNDAEASTIYNWQKNNKPTITIEARLP